MADRRVCCPTCRRRGIITVLARPVRESQGVALLIKPRATKILKKGVDSTRDGKTVLDVAIMVKCPRCKEVTSLPGRLLIEE